MGGEGKNNRLFSICCSSFWDKAYLFHSCFRDHFQYLRAITLTAYLYILMKVSSLILQ